jgi:hypothetical protein
VVDDCEHVFDAGKRKQTLYRSRRFRQAQRAARSVGFTLQVEKCDQACRINEVEPGEIDNDVSARRGDRHQARPQAAYAAGIKFPMQACHSAVTAENCCARRESNHVCSPIRRSDCKAKLER